MKIAQIIGRSILSHPQIYLPAAAAIITLGSLGGIYGPRIAEYFTPSRGNPSTEQVSQNNNSKSIAPIQTFAPLPENTPNVTPVPEDTPTPKPPAPAPSPLGYMAFNFDSGVSDENQTSIKDGIRIAKNYFAQNIGVDVKETVTVCIKSSDPGRNPVAVGWCRPDCNITIYTSHPVWRNSTDLQRKKIAVHEYFHILQRSLAGRDINPSGYYWLLEGSAELVGYQAMVKERLITSEQAREIQGISARSSPPATAIRPLPPLRSFDSPNSLWSTGGAYSLAYLAAESLTRDSGMGSLRIYFEGLGRGDDWRPVFEEAFRTSIDSFYQEFEQLRKALESE